MTRSLLHNLRILLGAALSAALLQPSEAAAHLVTTGMGPVYDGIGHLLLTPEDLVPALAMALYAGLRGRVPGRRALFFFPLAWLLGGFAGLFAGSMPAFPLSAVSFLLLGALIAADLRMPDKFFTILAVAVGIMHGFLNGIALKTGPSGLGLLGIMALCTACNYFCFSLVAEASVGQDCRARGRQLGGGHGSAHDWLVLSRSGMNAIKKKILIRPKSYETHILSKCGFVPLFSI